jgi:anti-sigma B factor antagonist
MTPTPPPFELRSSHRAEVLVVEASGEIDMETAPRLADAIDATAKATRLVVVDLTNVTFLDSSALNVLVHCQRSLADRGVGFRVVSPGDRVVHRVFEITHLTESLGVVESIDDALS